LHRHYVGFLLIHGSLLALAFLANLVVQELADLKFFLPFEFLVADVLLAGGFIFF